MEEAQSLNVRKELGHGSKWRAYLVLYGFLLLIMAVFYFQIRHDIPATYVPCVFAAIFIAAVIIVLWKRRQDRARQRTAARIEVTSADFTILGADSKVTMPWSAFSDCLSANLNPSFLG